MDALGFILLILIIALILINFASITISDSPTSCNAHNNRNNKRLNNVNDTKPFAVMASNSRTALEEATTDYAQQFYM